MSSSGTTAAGKDSKKSPASSGRRLDTSDLQEGRGGRRYVNGTFPREQDRDSKFSSSAPSSRIRVLIAANSKTEARSLSAMLSDRNELIGTATTFNELDATLHLRTDVDVLVTDVELGGATVFPCRKGCHAPPEPQRALLHEPQRAELHHERHPCGCARLRATQVPGKLGQLRAPHQRRRIPDVPQ